MTPRSAFLAAFALFLLANPYVTQADFRDGEALVIGGEQFPHWFGTLGESMYSLFQIMTLESWSMGIVRPVMEQYPAAWAFFVPFIVVTSFTVLNLFIALIVNSMQSLQAETKKELRAEATVAHDERELLLRRIDRLTEEVRKLHRQKSP